ncbi:ERV/ALR sulfhydryl oxidase domain-containing protein [Scheffersomyces xylosifermentans]|uniref:ERV/ALR sulfhydryl oxidase domain-containing protein n=1 Tax=Scheffersomyces xylosifermentans TaxID=1304137 RepID=UPI00315CC80A
MKLIRKPLVTTFTLVVIVSVIYFMTSSGDRTLGDSTPITRDSTPENQQQKLNLNLNEKINQPPLKSEGEEKPAADSIAGLTHDQGEQKKESQNKDSINALSQDHVEADKDINKDQQEPLSVELNEFTETPFMPKMANETLKAQLGNAAWKLFHTILARYPDKPSKQEQATLSQYIELFSQVYPCGDCARHFQKLLKKYPPQTGSRKTAALWGCDIHNKVNGKLKKEIYDCTTILEDYDCGCGDDEKAEDFTLGNKSMETVNKEKESKAEAEPVEPEVEPSKDDTVAAEEQIADEEQKEEPEPKIKKKRVGNRFQKSREHLRKIKIQEKEEEPQLGG